MIWRKSVRQMNNAQKQITPLSIGLQHLLELLRSARIHIIIAICVTSSDMVLKSFYFGAEGSKKKKNNWISLLSRSS